MGTSLYFSWPLPCPAPLKDIVPCSTPFSPSMESGSAQLSFYQSTTSDSCQSLSPRLLILLQSTFFSLPYFPCQFLRVCSRVDFLQGKGTIHTLWITFTPLGPPLSYPCSPVSPLVSQITCPMLVTVRVGQKNVDFLV